MEHPQVSDVSDKTASIADGRLQHLDGFLPKGGKTGRNKNPSQCATQREDRRWSGVLALASCGIAKCCNGTVNSSHLLAWSLENHTAGI